MVFTLEFWKIIADVKVASYCIPMAVSMKVNGSIIRSQVRLLNITQMGQSTREHSKMGKNMGEDSFGGLTGNTMMVNTLMDSNTVQECGLALKVTNIWVSGRRGCPMAWECMSGSMGIDMKGSFFNL